MSERLILKGLRVSDFQHPEDKKSLDFLERIPLLNSSLEAILKLTSEAMMKFVKAGSCIEINENQYPSVYRVFIQCCKILEIEKIPKLYLDGQRGISSSVDGITEPIVLISEGAVEVLNEDELYFIFGQALGHIKAGHELYHKVADLLIEGWGEVVGAMAMPIQEALLRWYRFSTLSSDRVGLLCCQSIDSAVSVLAKQAGYIRNYDEALNVDALMIQAEKFKESKEKMLNKFWEGFEYFSKNAKSPLSILRISELLEWSKLGEYGNTIYKNTSIEKMLGYDAITESIGFKKCIHCGYEKVRMDMYYWPNCKNTADR